MAVSSEELNADCLWLPLPDGELACGDGGPASCVAWCSDALFEERADDGPRASTAEHQSPCAWVDTPLVAPVSPDSLSAADVGQDASPAAHASDHEGAASAFCTATRKRRRSDGGVERGADELRALTLLRAAGVTPRDLVAWCNTPRDLQARTLFRPLCVSCAQTRAPDAHLHFCGDLETRSRWCSCVDVHAAVTEALRRCSSEPHPLMRKLAGMLLPVGARGQVCASLGIAPRMSHWTKRDAVRIVEALADDSSDIPTPLCQRLTDSRL
jgi:hypothetical protein